MPRLVAFGCSHTYGEGLEDCWNWETRKAGPVASKFAWPQILANLLKRECVNLGRRGASNKEILHNIQMFDFEKDDIQEQIDSILEHPQIHEIRKAGQDYAKENLTSEKKYFELKEMVLF